MDNNQEVQIDKLIEKWEDFDEKEMHTPDEFASFQKEETQKELNKEEQDISENKLEEKTKEEDKEELPFDLSPWEELDASNSIVKRYIFRVSKDFVPYIDSMTMDERSAYINDALQKKIDTEDLDRQKEIKKKLSRHFAVMLATIIFSMPFAIAVVHKAITVTFDNYKYSQENFEKLYKQRFGNDRAYMRSIQYNREQAAKKKRH